LATIAPTVWLFKLAFTFADLAICWVLSRYFGDRATLLYAWNPLILYSFAGAAHYDSWFILPLVLVWLMFEGKNRQPVPFNESAIPDRRPLFWVQSALLVGTSVAIKWMSLPVLGFLSWQAWKRSGIQSVGLVLLCGGLPLVFSALSFCQAASCPLIPTDSVFVSHGRSAELVPYLIGLLWQPSTQANWIYAVPLAAVVLWSLWRSQRLLCFIETYLFALLILSPIIHAWYFTWIIPFAVATRHWGTRLVSLSALIYFVLPHRLELGNPDWLLTASERTILWLPFLLGSFWTIRKNCSLAPSPLHTIRSYTLSSLSNRSGDHDET
jgi:alpha-1,6-mannosyltransferase